MAGRGAGIREDPRAILSTSFSRALVRASEKHLSQFRYGGRRVTPPPVHPEVNH